MMICQLNVHVIKTITLTRPGQCMSANSIWTLMKVNQLQIYSLIIIFVATRGLMLFRFCLKMDKFNLKKKLFGRSRLLIIEMFSLSSAPLMLSHARLMSQTGLKVIGIFFLENSYWFSWLMMSGLLAHFNIGHLLLLFLWHHLKDLGSSKTQNQVKSKVMILLNFPNNAIRPWLVSNKE